MRKQNHTHLLSLAGIGGLAVAAVMLLSMIHVQAAGATSDMPDVAAIDDFVATHMKALNLPGLALGIVHNDQIAHLRGFGVADPAGRPITPQTPFRIASLTKSFTALAVMQLVEAGRVDLDTPVQHYLPWFRVADAYASARITVRHLLNQTSGLSTLTGNSFVYTLDTSEQGLERFVRSLSTADLSNPVGEVAEYSNANYSILGLIVQIVSGESYEQYIQQHIFAPLDMHTSFVSQQKAQQHGLATGYELWFGVPTPVELPYIHEDLPAARIMSSAEDMSHYLIAYLNHGRYGDTSVLSSAGMTQLWQPPSYLSSENQSNYAMGWFVGTPYNESIIEHDGGGGNFHAYMGAVPDQGWGVVLLVNADHPALIAMSVDSLGRGVISQLIDQSSPEPPGIVLVRGLYLGTLVIVVIQLLGLIWAVRRLRHWNRQPESRPLGRRQVALRGVLPILLNVLAAFIFVVGMPQMLGVPLVGLMLFAPDWGYAMLLSGVLAIGWVIWGSTAFVTLRNRRTQRLVIQGS